MNKCVSRWQQVLQDDRPPHNIDRHASNNNNNNNNNNNTHTRTHTHTHTHTQQHSRATTNDSQQIPSLFANSSKTQKMSWNEQPSTSPEHAPTPKAQRETQNEHQPRSPHRNQKLIVCACPTLARVVRPWLRQRSWRGCARRRMSCRKRTTSW
jgi:hypothetical protein